MRPEELWQQIESWRSALEDIVEDCKTLAPNVPEPARSGALLGIQVVAENALNAYPRPAQPDIDRVAAFDKWWAEAKAAGGIRPEAIERALREGSTLSQPAKKNATSTRLQQAVTLGKILGTVECMQTLLPALFRSVPDEWCHPSKEACVEAFTDNYRRFQRHAEQQLKALLAGSDPETDQ